MISPAFCLHREVYCTKIKGTYLRFADYGSIYWGDYPRVYSPTFARMLAAIHADGRNQ